MSQLIEIPSDDAIGNRVNETLRGRLSERRAKFPDYEEQLERTFQTSSKMSLPERLRFRFYRRQFEGGTTLILPLSIKAGRFLLRNLSRYRDFWSSLVWRKDTRENCR